MTNSSPPHPTEDEPTRPRRSIPLQNLSPQYSATTISDEGSQYYGTMLPAASHLSTSYPQGTSHVNRGGPTTAQMAANIPGISTYWEQPYTASNVDGGTSPESPIDPSALQFALPPEIHQSPPTRSETLENSRDPYDSHSPYYDDSNQQDYSESDRVPLTSKAQPISGALNARNGEAQPRDSFQTVLDLDNSPGRAQDARSFGANLDPSYIPAHHRSYGNSLSPGDYRSSRVQSTSGALYRAGSLVRAMSQRVVNISGEGELVDQRAQSHRSRPSTELDPNQQRRITTPMLVDTSYPSQLFQMPPEKMAPPEFIMPEQPLPSPSRGSGQNPLKGMSLGVFSPDNPIRRRFCDLLVNPYTEPFILILIVLQAILLAVDAAPNVFLDGNGRPERWAWTKIDYAMLGLFVVFTLELIARIIVSGLILNAAEYSTIDRQRGVRAAVVDQYRAIFQPQRLKSVRGTRQVNVGPSAFSRSFTIMQGQTLPQTVEEQQRFQLARRAFLRHSFNRLDLLAVVSFWVSFVLSISGLESRHHLYVFRMLSCLRIIRLLALTNGTAVRLSRHPCLLQPANPPI
jgi:voltage-dependent calcium channel